MANPVGFAHTFIAFSVLLIAAVLNSQVEANTIPREDLGKLKDENIGLTIDEYSKSTNDFSQHFMTQVWNDNDNFVFSPLSIHVTLAMLASSATENSDTQKQLLGVLGRTKTLHSLENYYQTTLTDYEKTSTNTLKFGNKLWTTEELFTKINDTYLLSLDEKYKTGFSFLEEVEPEKAVNEWIADVTNNKIKKLYDQLPGDISMLLTNAVWFKDSWSQPFDPVLESDRNMFYLSDGSKVRTEMMERTSYEFIVSDTFNFEGLINDQNFKAIAIPYEYDHNQRFEIVFVIPEKLRGLEFLKESLSNQVHASTSYKNIFDTIDAEIETARQKDVEYTVVMPTFKIASDIDAEEYLREMGVISAFDVGEFGYLAKETPLKVSGVKHKSTVEVTVEGTEGAAATGIDLVPLSFSDFREVRIDRPFIFFIRDRYKGSFLFAGKIENPNDANNSPK